MTPTEMILKEVKKIADRQQLQEKALAELAKPVTNAAALFAQPRDLHAEGKKGFATPREFMLCVMTAGMGQQLDKRLAPLKVKAAGSDEQSGISDPYGGFLVPPSFLPEVLKLDPEADPIGARTRKVPMSVPTVKVPARVDKNHTTSVSGGLTVTRRPQTVAATSSRMELESIQMDALSLFGFAYATEEIMTDSPQTFAALISDGFNDQFVYHLTNERLNGTGVGEFLGMMHQNNPCLITVSKDQGQAADTITFSNVVNMRSRCWKYNDAMWLANHDTSPQLMQLNQIIGVGGNSVWLPSAREDRPDLLFGRPLIFTEFMNTVGDKGDIGLFVWSEYLEGTLQPLQSDESMHVRFINHERTFKFFMRNAGQPWWRSPLTPKNSTSTLSPAVVLEAR